MTSIDYTHNEGFLYALEKKFESLLCTVCAYSRTKIVSPEKNRQQKLETWNVSKLPEIDASSRK